MTLQYRCDALTSWAKLKPLTLGAGNLWVLTNPQGMNDEIIYEIYIITQNCNDHSLFDFTSAVQCMIYFILYFHHNVVVFAPLWSSHVGTLRVLSCFQFLPDWSVLSGLFNTESNWLVSIQGEGVKFIGSSTCHIAPFVLSTFLFWNICEIHIFVLRL